MKFWKHILSKLLDSQQVYLLTVIQNFGSSPGRKGFKMMVAEDGFIFGSIGGGVMEYNLVEETKLLLKQDVKPILLKKQIHKGNKKDSSGMICSGEQTVVFHPLDKDAIPAIQKLIDCLQSGKKGCLKLTSNSFYFSDDLMSEKHISEIKSDKEWNFKEQIGFKKILYIIGGGHVGLSLSKLMVELNFNIVVFDNRKNLNTLQSNKYTNDSQVIEYAKIADFIPEGNDSYVAIMTNKYTDDKLVLSKLINKEYKYIGVLGSKSKLKIMWEVLLKEGVSQQQLDTVFAPIGISIKSETTEEIAVSIAAQIIQIKNKTE